VPLCFSCVMPAVLVRAASHWRSRGAWHHLLASRAGLVCHMLATPPACRVIRHSGRGDRAISDGEAGLRGVIHDTALSTSPHPPCPHSYYWDSYWVVMGLLRCNMTATAKGVVLNLVHLLDTFGFVPNGGRVYYALPGRSQPPLLSSMVMEVWQATGDDAFLTYVYPSLVSEYAWWMRGGPVGHAVNITVPASAAGGGGSVTYTLNRYVTNQTVPRPESWYEDVHTATSAGLAANSSGAAVLYTEIAAGAETGWDFSSRWFADGADIATCDTSRVVPADLNAILYAVEANLATFAGALADRVADSGHCIQQLRGWMGAVASTAARMNASGASGNGGGRGGSPNAGGTWVTAQHAPFLRLGRTHQTAVACQRLARTVHADFALTMPALEAAANKLVPTLRLNATRFAFAAASRRAAIDALMWDESRAAWTDLRIVNGVPLHAATDTQAYYPDTAARGGLAFGSDVVPANVTSASNYAPLWTGALDAANITRVAAILTSFVNSSLAQIGGIATTTANTSQQWDWPNGWAPLQHMLIVGLNATGYAPAQNVARELARRWLLSCLVAWVDTGFMHEKYDVRGVGDTGAGGEYSPQVGCGEWGGGGGADARGHTLRAPSPGAGWVRVDQWCGARSAGAVQL